MRLLFIFIDGVGLGKNEPNNPLAHTDTPGLTDILDGRRLIEDSAGYCGPRASLIGLDATLGVSGLPQSATGQTSIFTGINAPALLGCHLNGFPEQRLRRLLSSKGVFRQLKRKGFNVAFSNAYRPLFFEYLRRGLPGNRYSCSTLITYYGRIPFYSLNDLKAGRALYMDITNDILKRMGFDVPLITPEEGAARLAEISRRYDFCLFEYFLTDLAGHMSDRAEAGRVINILDRFIGTLSGEVNSKETLLIITSDHGNLEDISGRDHTYNNVPAILIGDLRLRRFLHSGLRDLTDLLPAVFSVLGWVYPGDLS
ncbi:MAG: hypothetical protein ACQESO_03300 [Bacillota bacterium]